MELAVKGEADWRTKLNQLTEVSLEQEAAEPGSCRAEAWKSESETSSPSVKS